MIVLSGVLRIDHLWRSAAVAIVLFVTVGVSNVLACDVYGSNHGAAAWNVVTNFGIKGTTATPTVNPIDWHTTAIVHPAQVASPVGSDFLGWGTKKGVGTTGGSTNCSTTDNNSWSIYLDGIVNGVYFCVNGGYGTVPNGHTGDTFQMLYSTCFFSPYAPAYVMKWNGVNKTCKNMNSTTGLTISAGGESLGTSSVQDVTEHYYGMKYYKPNVGFTDFGTLATCAESGYQLLKNSNTDWWATIP